MSRPKLAFGPEVRHPRSDRYPTEFSSSRIQKRVVTLCSPPTASVFSARPRPRLALTSGPAGERGHSGPAVVVHPVIDSPVGAVASPSPIPVRSVPPSPVGFKPASEPGGTGRIGSRQQVAGGVSWGCFGGAQRSYGDHLHQIRLRFHGKSLF